MTRLGRPFLPRARGLTAGVSGALALVALVLGLCVTAPARAQGSPAADHPAFAVPPSSRQPLLPLVQPQWKDLTPAQRAVLAPIEPHWNSLSMVRKLAWVSMANKVPLMQKPERELALERIREWAALTPEQRRQARDNFRLAKRLGQDERVARWENYRQLPEDKLSALREERTSNTAARHAGARTGLAKQAARPLPGVTPPPLAPLPLPAGFKPSSSEGADPFPGLAPTPGASAPATAAAENADAPPPSGN